MALIRRGAPQIFMDPNYGSNPVGVQPPSGGPAYVAKASNSTTLASNTSHTASGS